MCDPRLVAEVAAQPLDFVYVAVTGEHLYGFDAPDSGYDLRGCHVLPAADVLGLRPGRDTVAFTVHRDGLDIEFLSYDLAKLCVLLLKKNGAVLEQICSPHVVTASPDHAELIEIAKQCASRHMAHHYLSHAKLHWSLAQENPRAVAVLHAVRTLLAGTHLMRTGEVESRLPHLAEDLPWVADLQHGGPPDMDFCAAEFERLAATLEEAKAKSRLPAMAADDARDRLSDLLVRLRLR